MAIGGGDLFSVNAVCCSAQTFQCSHTHGPESFEAFQFVDDGWFSDPALGTRPWMCVGIWEKAHKHNFGNPEALNKEND